MTTAREGREVAGASLVSIITPAYNHQDYIATCIDSVLAQTYGNWEQIIIDDGSTDDTGKIVSQYRDPRIRYERQSNRGPFELAHTYNRALSLAKGELIAILEGDDFWPPDKLATLMPAFREDAVVLAYGERVDVDVTGRRQRRKTGTARRRESLGNLLLRNDPVGSATRYMLLEDGRSLVGPCTAVIRKSALDKIGGFQWVAGLPLTDYPTFLELSMIGKFFYSRQTLGYLRRHQSSVTVNHARIIHEAVSRFARRFVEKNSDKLVLSSSDWDAIEHSWREGKERLHFAEGRVLLLRQSWQEARGHFRIASRSRNAKVRTAAFAGFLLSLAHMNLEPIMKMGGRSGMRPSAIQRSQPELQ
jgi:glycosyltransferase involved in cell wall biosynthesis